MVTILILALLISIILSLKIGYKIGYDQGYINGYFEKGFQANLRTFKKTLGEIIAKGETEPAKTSESAVGCVLLTPGATWIATNSNEALGQAVTDASKDGTRDVLVKAKPGAVYTESFGKMPEVPREPVFIKEL